MNLTELKKKLKSVRTKVKKLDQEAKGLEQSLQKSCAHLRKNTDRSYYDAYTECLDCGKSL